MDILCTDKTGTLTATKLCWRIIRYPGKPSEHVLHCAPAEQPLSGIRSKKIYWIRQSRGSRRNCRVSSPDAGRKSMRFRLILSVAGCRWWWPKIPGACINRFVKARYRRSERVYRQRHNGDIVPLDDNMLRRVKRVTDTLNRRATRGRRRDQIPACA